MRRSPRVPSYCLHRHSGRGYARFGAGSKPTYFPGQYDSPESRAAYHAALAEYLAGGRPAGVTPGENLTVLQLIASWWREAESRYVKFGRVTSEITCQQAALKFVRQLYAGLPAAEFGSAQLAAVRQQMVEAKWVRTSINLHMSRIRAVWKWAASQNLVPVASWQALTTLGGLREGRTMAPEPRAKLPPTIWQLRAVLSRCAPAVGAMVRLQYLCGMRPGEVCALRPCDMDRSESEWLYRVDVRWAKVGTEVYWLGPRARAVLSPWLDPSAPEARVFAYTTASYRRHVARCCRAAGCVPWSPHALRHAHGTNVVNAYGLEGAGRRLNHTQEETTRRYSRSASALARRIAKEMG